MTDTTTVLRSAIDSRSTREPVVMEPWLQSPQFKLLKPPLWIGGSSVYDQRQRHKYIDYDKWEYTTTEQAREYLRYCFQGQSSRKRVGFDRSTYTLFDVPPPHFFDGYHRGNLALVDISSCYYQLYQSVGLDVKFDPFKGYVGLGEVTWLDPRWFELQSKSFKRSIAGIIRQRTGDVWDGHRLQVIHTHNKFLAPELWGYMMFILHYAATEITNIFSPYYWNVDGCIIDAELAGVVMDYLRHRWNLESIIKLGPGAGEVRGIGSYDIGAKKGGHQWHGKRKCNYLPYDKGFADKLADFRAKTLEVI